MTFNSFSPQCTLPNGTHSGYVSGPSARSTLGIVWSCISIIILSTWSILHLDVPADITPRNKRQKFCKFVYLLWRKIFWMGLKLFSPEFAATGCARKIFATRSNSVLLERLAHIDGVPWSLTHTILVDMGGIALRFVSPDSTSTKESTPTPSPNELTPVNTSTPTPNSADSESSFLLGPTAASKSNSPKFVEKFRHKQDRILGLCGDVPWKEWPLHVKHARDMEEEKDLKGSIYNDIAALTGNIWILDSRQFAIAREKGIITMPKYTEQEITDKSKSDGLVKLIAMLQVLWLVVQLVVRKIGNLPFSQLEITTVAFAATAVIIYCIDFIKPKDVNVPFYIDVTKEVDYEAFVAIAEAAPFPYVQSKRYYMPTSTLHDIVNIHEAQWRPKERCPNEKCEQCEQCEQCKQNETSKKNKKCKLCKDCERCRRCIQCRECQQCKWCGQPRSSEPQSAMLSESEVKSCFWCRPFKFRSKTADIYSLLIGFISATSFGGVHLFAWNNEFPTEIEKLLWRISAFMTIALPYIYIFSHLPFILKQKPFKTIDENTKLGMTILMLCIAICYVPCRLFLLTESFRSLYFLPPEAFNSTWAANIPHLG